MKILLVMFGLSLASQAVAGEVICESTFNDKAVPGTTLRGVTVFVQDYEGNRSQSKTVWFNDDKDARDAAGPKCWGAVKNSACTENTRQKVYGRGGATAMVSSGYTLTRPDGSSEHFSPGTFFWSDSSAEKCWNAQIELAVTAMALDKAGAKKINAAAFKAAEEARKQAAWDRSLNGKANQL